MSISLYSVILGYQGTGQPVKTTLTCGRITALNVDYIASLKISRLTGRELGSTYPIVITSVRAGESGASIPLGVTDIRNRATVSGGIDTLDPKQSSIALEFQPSNSPVVMLDNISVNSVMTIHKPTLTLYLNQPILQQVVGKCKWYCLCAATSENVPSKLCELQRFRSVCTLAQSDQNLHFALSGWLRLQFFFLQTTKILIRLRGCKQK